MLATGSCTEIVNVDTSSKRTSPPGKDLQRFLGSPETEYPTSQDTPPLIKRKMETTKAQIQVAVSEDLLIKETAQMTNEAAPDIGPAFDEVDEAAPESPDSSRAASSNSQPMGDPIADFGRYLAATLPSSLDLENGADEMPEESREEVIEEWIIPQKSPRAPMASDPEWGERFKRLDSEPSTPRYEKPSDLIAHSSRSTHALKEHIEKQSCEDQYFGYEHQPVSSAHSTTADIPLVTQNNKPIKCRVCNIL